MNPPRATSAPISAEHGDERRPSLPPINAASAHMHHAAAAAAPGRFDLLGEQLRDHCVGVLDLRPAIAAGWLASARSASW